MLYSLGICQYKKLKVGWESNKPSSITTKSRSCIQNWVQKWITKWLFVFERQRKDLIENYLILVVIYYLVIDRDHTFKKVSKLKHGKGGNKP